MKCIFCKSDSSTSKSQEHIIPESLWNHKQVLERGVVCDTCNNYFARKVERPFLESTPMQLLRFFEGIPNKKGRFREIVGFIKNKKVIVRHDLDKQMEVTIPKELWKELFESERSQKLELIIPSPFQDIQIDADPTIVERFVAKVAVEAFAQLLLVQNQKLEPFIEEAQFNPIRQFARRGQPLRWPVHIRQIYPRGRRWPAHDGSDYQLTHEYDFFLNEQGEGFFAMAIFGTEFVINMLSPDLSGYHSWLSKNDNASPLYSPKKAPKFYQNP